VAESPEKWYNNPMSFDLPALSPDRTIPVLLAIGALAGLDLVRRWRHQPTHLLFAVVLGTFLSFALIRTVGTGIEAGKANPYLMTAVLILVLIAWRSLFGPWEVTTKATVLGTFLFWVTGHLLWRQSGDEQIVRLVAAGVALVPAVVWILLFLKYHAERASVVVLLFFAGMLSTAPILFYDLLVRRGVELQFFLFTLSPQSFSRTASRFVSEHVPLESGVATALVTSLVTFLFVALIEEASKYWVLTRNAKPLFRSIDDVLQLSIVVAIGFAFAENVVNPVYFTAFVRQYLFHGAAPDMGAFFGNVLGRSVLTTMVHVLSTGIMGYFFALALFAGPYLKERHAEGRAYRLTRWLHSLLRVPEESVFRVNMLATGFVLAVLLHAAFNFLVTIPELLPGQPDTLGEIVGPSLPSFLANIPFLMVPSLFYVVGGFWILTSLFLRKENMVELGHLQPETEGE